MTEQEYIIKVLELIQEKLEEDKGKNMIILTDEHKDKYLKNLKDCYEKNQILIERIESDSESCISQQTLEELKNNNEEIKAHYEALKNLEKIYLDENYRAFSGNNCDWVWLIALCALFGGNFGNSNDSEIN